MPGVLITPRGRLIEGDGDPALDPRRRPVIFARKGWEDHQQAWRGRLAGLPPSSTRTRLANALAAYGYSEAEARRLTRRQAMALPNFGWRCLHAFITWRDGHASGLCPGTSTDLSAFEPRLLDPALPTSDDGR
jgi:hypothetical protein